MAATRFYSSTAGQMFLSASVTSGDTSATLATVTGLPGSLPYTLLLDPGLATEEVVEVTAIGGAVVTITRGMDGTSGQAHSNGAEVRHGFSARDFQDSRNHEANTTTAHGVTGVVVGTTNTQTLTGKTISGSSNTISNVPQGALPATSVDTTTAQTLTTKTMSGTSNTFSAIPNSAVTNSADLGSMQTLTNKTIDGNWNTITNAIPAGVISMFGGAVAPTGYLLCNGAAVSRTGANAYLFSAIGTAYGAGDGSTTFNVPSFANNFPMGNTPGATGGEATHILTTAEMPSHTHGITFHGGLNPQSVLTQALDGGAGRYDLASGTPDWLATATGGGGAHNNLPPFLGVTFIIKL